MGRPAIKILHVRSGRVHTSRALSGESDAEHAARAMHRAATDLAFRVGDYFVRWYRRPYTLGDAYRWAGFYAPPERVPGLYTLITHRGRKPNRAISLQNEVLVDPGEVA